MVFKKFILFCLNSTKIISVKIIKCVSFLIWLPLAILTLKYRILSLLFKKQTELPAIVINTNINYSAKTIPPMITSLVKNHINLENVFVIEGGYSQNSTEKNNLGYTLVKVNNNSFDFTALIGILEENPFSNKSFYYLHDTIKITKLFTLLYKTNNYGILNKYDVIPLRKSPSMNIGLYSLNYIIKKKYEILKFKNEDYSSNSINKSKLQNILNEDMIFKLTSNKIYLNSWLSHFEFFYNVQYMGKPRRKEYYPQLGIIKFKANHNILSDFVTSL